jgi:hypothetical protein
MMAIPKAVYRYLMKNLWRFFRMFGYIVFLVVGVVMFVSPSGVVQGQMGDFIVVWALMLGIGGALTTAGMVTKLWAGEALGLPLLAFGSAMWGVAYLREVPLTSGRFAVGAVLIGVGSLFFAKWLEVNKLGSDATKVAEQEKRDDNGE